MCFGFQEDIIYNIITYNKGLFNNLYEIIPISKELILNKIKKSNFNKIIDHRQIVRFFYDAINNNEYNNAFKFLPFFQEDFLIALYIYTIKGKKNAY